MRYLFSASLTGNRIATILKFIIESPQNPNRFSINRPSPGLFRGGGGLRFVNDATALSPYLIFLLPAIQRLW